MSQTFALSLPRETSEIFFPLRINDSNHVREYQYYVVIPARIGIKFLLFLYIGPPSLGDLCEHMTPKHAVDWKVIGTLLGIPYEELKKIEARFPRSAECCCDKMWGKWLKTDSNAIWSKLLAVILSLTVSHRDGNGE